MGSIFPVASAGVFRAFLRLYCRSRCWMRITAATSPACRRFLCFSCGVLLASLFWVTPLAHLEHQSLTGHMVQHLLLMTVSAPLILFAEPMLILRQSVPQWAAGSFDKPRRQRSLDSGVQSSIWLVSCWMAGTATVIWWHIPSVFAFSMHSHVGHEIEKTTFFLGGLFFWWPVLRQWADRKRTPHWSIVVYLFLATLPCDVLSAFLTFYGRVAYAFYASGPESMQSAALRDQERAGALMWAWVTFAYLAPAVLTAISKLSGSCALSSLARHQAQRSPRTEDPGKIDDASTLAVATPAIDPRRNVAGLASVAKMRLGVLSPGPLRKRSLTAFKRLSDFWALTKPEVNFLILITTFAGFYLGSANAGRPFSSLALLYTLLGTLLVASGTATLNQYIERNFDAQMRRTARRPAASGRLAPNTVLAFGIVLSLAGCIYLAAAANMLASLLAVLTLLSYLFFYTPLKRKTPLCVLVGAFPGAMPSLIGWAAASERLNTEAWLLYGIVFLWQFPHFMAIAWLYREEYDRAGYLMLPRTHRKSFFVIVQTILPLLALIPLSVAHLSGRHSAILYCVRLLLALGFVYFGLEFVFHLSRKGARRLLTASIAYLPLFLLVRVVLR